MPDKTKLLALTRDLRTQLGTVYFSDLSGPDRRDAISRMLLVMPEAALQDAEVIVEKERSKEISTENAAEELSIKIIAGWALKKVSEKPTKAQIATAEEVVRKRRADNIASVTAALRVAAEAASNPEAAEAAKTQEEIKATVDTVEETGDTSPEEGTVEELEPIVVTAPKQNPGEESIMEPIDFDAVKELIDQSFAFNESQLPERLHYDKVGEERRLSFGQEKLLQGTAEAIGQLGYQISVDPNAVGLLGAVVGILLLDGHNEPDAQAFYGHVMDAMNELNSAADPNHGDVGNQEFEGSFTLARHVFKAVGDIVLQQGTSGTFFDDFAAVGREMVDIFDSVKPGDRGFDGAVRARYANQSLKLGGSSGGGTGVAFLDLPPLNDPSGTSNEIVRENVQAISSIYVVYQCEQMMLFSVTERIVELFMAGLLPMQGDTAARYLDDYYWSRDEKVSPTGRAAQYTRALGAPGGDVGGDVTPNQEFNSHLMRVVSSIAEYERQNSVGNLLDNTGRRAQPASGEFVRKAIRDLGANCTLYGFAGVQFAAERMGKQLKSAMTILQLPRVKEIYGVTTMWQVIERVAQSEFGTTVNVVKHRTMAEEVRKMLDVVAVRPDAWTATTGNSLFHPLNNMDTFQSSDLSADDTAKLFRAAQYFLAVNGVQNDQVYEYSQPVDTPALPSIPGMGTWNSSGSQQTSPMPAMPDDPFGGLQNMAASGRAATGADIINAVNNR